MKRILYGVIICIGMIASVNFILNLGILLKTSEIAKKEYDIQEKQSEKEIDKSLDRYLN
ncbi:hypothetical protein [Gottschalkia acidurici]|uniref:hypothetical protein n=1 Tax=Clostridium acidurici TaxID=1556 RepID=UPI0002EC2655|nr:hypothetical protein [Gottschalkia acidurici]